MPRSFILSLLIILYAAPLTARAAAATEIFALPEARAAEAYQSDIEAVLRDKYRLKIESGARASTLQWAMAEGEIPPGLTIRTDGKIVGTPKVHREQPYQFRVKVVDLSISGSDPLTVPLSLSVAPPRLRLTRINAPALVPLETTAPLVNSPTTETSATMRPAVAVEPATAAAPSSQGSRMVGSLPLLSPPEQADWASSSRASRPTRQTGGGLFSRVASMVGFGQGDGKPDRSGATKGCANGSNVRRVTSDERHNGLKNDTSTQNTCVEFINLNTLKYRYEFNEDRTRSEGPNLGSLPFLPKITLTAATPPAAQTGNSTPTPAFLGSRTVGITDSAAKARAEADATEEWNTLNRNFKEARNKLSEVEESLRVEVEQVINDNITKVQNAHARSKSLADGADQYLQFGNAADLLTEVGSLKTELETARAAPWPSDKITDVLNDLDRVTVLLEDIKIKDGTPVSQDAWKEWLAANEGRYNRVRDRIAELKNKVNTINNGATAFNDSKRVLDGWQLVVNNVDTRKEQAFKQEAFVSCHTDEGEGQSSKLTISKLDRTATNAVAVSRDVLTVNCYSRVAVTGGFNFSSLDEREFSVVQSAGAEPGATVKKFGFTNRSGFRLNPLAMVNIRFTENPVYNWHASFGALVDLKGQTGTDIEPVAGVSFSIRRLIFITPLALHFGRVNRLAGGFKEGDLVPEAIATPPLEKAWKIGYTAGVTFRIAPQ
ncbi:MAG TPA: putative Ig domain-containing protein [Pyrinomonadaceae bacterium]|nr:putative Ig domain-containing protein [Pyrinomonadaceae bacterium]